MAKIKRDRNLGNGTQNKSRRPKYRRINKYGLIGKNYNKCRYFPQLKPTCIYSSYFHKYVPKSLEKCTELSVLVIK